MKNVINPTGVGTSDTKDPTVTLPLSNDEKTKLIQRNLSTFTYLQIYLFISSLSKISPSKYSLNCRFVNISYTINISYIDVWIKIIRFMKFIEFM